MFNTLSILDLYGKITSDKGEDKVSIDREIRERKIRRTRARKRRRRVRVLTAILCLMLIVTGIVATAAHFSTNVYKNDEEFKEYAELAMDESPFSMQGETEKIYEYGSPISYAADFEMTDDERVAEFRNSRVEQIKAEFSSRKADEEAERKEKNGDDKGYEPLEEALLVNAAVYESGNGATSLAIYYSDNEEYEKDMKKLSSGIETYVFSTETGLQLRPVQVFREDYREKCSKYFTEYFQKTYSEEELEEGWQDHLTADESNFSKFIMTKGSVIFYFDEGTVLKKSHGVVQAKISNEVMAESRRDTVIQRYITTDKPMVALTYDDGPGADSETRILDCLEKNGAVATFFYCGNRVSSNPGQIKRAYEMGCELGNHTWNHPKLTSLSEAEVKEQIQKTNEAVKSACGEYPTVFRPSYGATNDTINSIAGMPVIMWSIDTLDWKSKDAQKIFDSVTKSSDLDGKIILMHSIHDFTAEATEKIVPWLNQNGYQTVTVSELIKYKLGETPQNGKKYW